MGSCDPFIHIATDSGPQNLPVCSYPKPPDTGFPAFSRHKDRLFSWFAAPLPPAATKSDRAMEDGADPGDPSDPGCAGWR